MRPPPPLPVDRAPRPPSSSLRFALSALLVVAGCGNDGAAQEGAPPATADAGRAEAEGGPERARDAAPPRLDAAIDPSVADAGPPPDARAAVDLRPGAADAARGGTGDGAVNLAPCKGCGLAREGVRRMMVLAAGTGPQRAPHDADRSLCEKVNPPFGTVFVGGSATYRYAGFCYGGTTASFNRSFVSIDLESAAGGAPRFRGQTALKAATFAFSRPYDNNPDAFFVDEAIVLVAVGAPGGTVAECEASAFRSGTIDARTSTCALEKLTVSLDDLARPTKLRVAFADGGREEVPLFDLTLPP